MSQKARAVVVVPIYKPELDHYEFFALKNSLRILAARDVGFAAPRGLDLAFYADNFPGAGFTRFDDEYFASIDGYNRLMTSRAFYEAFAPSHEFMLLLQPDALVFRDDLDDWMQRGVDYVGAPWPDFVMVGLPGESPRFPGQRLAVGVGNGGLSLRRIGACLDALGSFDWVLGVVPMPEDVFFSVVGQLSAGFRIPGQAAAARFAVEFRPLAFLESAEHSPMGFHAWRKFGRDVCPRWMRMAGYRNVTPVRRAPGA